MAQSGARRDPEVEYIVLNRNCLRDIRDPEEPNQLQLGSAHTESFYRSWADEQLARIQSSNSQSAHSNVMSRLDMALRILSGLEMPESLGDPLNAIGREVFVSLGHLQDLGLEYKYRCLDTNTKIYSVTAAVFHDKYRKCIACMDEAVKARRGLDKHQDIQPAIQHLHLAVHHARKAADGGFFTRAVAMVGMDFRDLARAYGVDIQRYRQYDALLSAVAEFQTRAGLEELGNMLDDPENGFGSPVCTLPACKSHSWVRTPTDYPRLVRCADGCPDALHATYCSVGCRDRDAARHAMAANGAYERKPPICLDGNAEAGQLLKELFGLTRCPDGERV